MASKPSPSSSSLFDGVINPRGLFMTAIGPLFLAVTPLTSALTKPNSVVQSTITSLLSLIPGTSFTSGSSFVAGSSVAPDRVIPALSVFYIFFTFAATGAASAGGQGAARREGLDSNHPRRDVNNLTGLPLRLRSAHYNLMEMFPGFALAASLAQTLAPNNQQIVNLLGLHVLLKCVVFYPAYVCDVAPVRSLSHLFATASVIDVAWRLATGAL